VRVVAAAGLADSSGADADAKNSVATS